MTAVTAIRLPRSGVPTVLVAVAAAVAGLAGRHDAFAVLAAGALIGATLGVDVQLPQGGAVPVGHAVVVAFAYSLDPAFYGAACALGLLVHAPVAAARFGHRAAVSRLGWFAGSMLAGGAVGALLHGAVPDRGAPAWGRTSLAVIFAIGCAYLAVVLVRRAREGVGNGWRQVGPVFVSLLCSAALLAMADGWMVLFAALPLAMTKYSFERYFAARRTYEQTIQALGIVPELAGHVALGHSERTAFYAQAIAAELGLDPATSDHVVTAARLHHIGSIAEPDADEPASLPDRQRVGATGAQILRETGFLAAVADLVEDAGDLEPTASTPVEIVRVATAFDDLVGEDAARARGALSLLASQGCGDAWGRAVGALRACVDGDRDFVERAIAHGAPLTAAAAAAAEHHAAG